MSVLYENAVEDWSDAAAETRPRGAQTSASTAPAAYPNTVVLHIDELLPEQVAGLTDIVTAIYGHVRAGRRVVAVVSAADAATAPLLRMCTDHGTPHDNVTAPALVALAHERSAAALALACDRAGLCAIALRSSELGLVADGERLRATQNLCDDRTALIFADHDVVILPGSVAADAAGRTVLLDDARATSLALAAALGADATSLRPPPAARRIRVALAGLGVVGAGVAARLLQRPERYDISGVLVRDLGKPRDVQLDRRLVLTCADALLATQPDLVVDLLSEGALGAALNQRALDAGIGVVSANKQAIAAAYDPLWRAARSSGAPLHYAAAVGGGAPILETVRRARDANADIYAMEGVLNGTVNFVLSLLARGESLAQALAKARSAGLVEADASMDLSGRDAAAKLELIAREAFSVMLGELHIEPLTAAVARLAGNVPLKQVSRISVRNGAIRGEVVFEPAAHGPFAQLGGDRNAIHIASRDGRQWRAQGRGAGRWPTTESVMADVLAFAAQC